MKKKKGRPSMLDYRKRTDSHDLPSKNKHITVENDKIIGETTSIIRKVATEG
jgi:hypothetical protein